MLQPWFSPTPTSTIDGWRSSGNVNFTGWTSTTGFGSECVSRCAWHLDTCRRSVNLCPEFLVTVIYARSAGRGELDFPRVNLSTYGRRAFAFAGPVHVGTCCLTLNNINLSLQTFNSNVILIHSFFLHTSKFSTFEVFTKNVLYKYKFTVIVITISL